MAVPPSPPTSAPSACARVVSDYVASPSDPLATRVLFSVGEPVWLALSHLDRAQVASVAVLELLRWVAAVADGASVASALAVRHAVDWPELRLVPSTLNWTGDGTTTLPMGRGGQRAPSQLSRLLDYRCHAPDGALGKGFPRSMTQCLGVLARSPSDRAVPATEDGGIAEALGVRTAKQRKAVAAYAVRMLGEGMEAAVSAAGREWQSPLGLTPATPPPCCSMLACDRPLPLPPPSSPPLPSPRSTLGLAALGRPHHPRSLGLLWMPTRPASHMLTRGENGRTVETIPAAVASLATASINHASRDASAFYARAAAARLADAGGLPSAFDDRYLNPCWLCNRSLCCLPYAHILGVSKCGTTDLYARLAAHPSVLASANKGPHFWDEGSHDFSWYVSLFTGGAAKLQDGTASATSIFVDASSNTLTYAGVGVRGERHPLPPVLLPQVLAWLQPALRLVAILREPAARYYSAYLYYDKRYRIYRRYGPHGARGFAAMAAAEVDGFRRCRQAATVRRCTRLLYAETEQLIKGLYAPALEAWLSTFPPQQLLVLRLEDYEATPARHLRAVLAFLALARPPRALWRRMLAQPHANRHNGGAEPMLATTRILLQAFYAEHNEQLAHLLGEASYLQWNDNRTGYSPPRSTTRAGRRITDRITIVSR